MKQRLDQKLVRLGLVSTRSQAESYIKLGDVKVNGTTVTKPGYAVNDDSTIELSAKEQYVSRAALKLASVAELLKLDFKDKLVLDVGSSTGGFTDYALRHGAGKVIAVEIGTNQLHPSLREHPLIELHEKTDIRSVQLNDGKVMEPAGTVLIDSTPDIIVADVSFISLREILPHISSLSSPRTDIVAMLKPQFEAGQSSLKHKGVIKNDRIRRDILKEFENWAQHSFRIIDKADSEVAGTKGNRERFYLLRTLTD
jgi:23S rRNA (cytidine1920-2'-O)/16S rRNA (cytidine1409-2'-O)-methyltransferase